LDDREGPWSRPAYSGALGHPTTEGSLPAGLTDSVGHG